MKKQNAPVKKSKKYNITLGPVLNLEEHVRSEWWKEIFDGAYLKTDADIVEDFDITRNEVNFFTKILGLNSNDHILDLCCGQGRHIIELANRGFRDLEGIDRSHYLIQTAKSRCRKEHLTVNFKEGDARKLPYKNDTFDVITLLGNSFGYFDTISDDFKVLKEVYRVLKPMGRLLIDVANGAYQEQSFQPKSWEWINKKLFVCRERSLSLDKQKMISREIITHVEKGILRDQFYAVRLYNKDNLTQLLLKCGFCDVNFHGEIFTDSKRNEDLGMMESRIILTSVVKKEWSVQVKPRSNGTKNVVVLLGDPKKTDIVKPRGIFDDDDFNTINQMKQAMSELVGYEITYLDNHDTLISDLLKIQGKKKIDYVFNLCDEGYSNDSNKELHIPSLLEILNLPYSGSGPKTLAYCYDKSLIRGIAQEMNIPVPKAFLVNPEDNIFELPIEFPVIVKPNYGDSSFGITQKSVAYSVEQLTNAIIEIRAQFGYDKPVLVEEFLIGDDLSLGIIGNPPEAYKVLPIIKEDYSGLPEDLPRICGYEAKWLPDSPYAQIKSVPIYLPSATEEFIIACSTKIAERVECRDYSRFDWRLNAKGNPKLLEINPNPGWCWDGHLCKMSMVEGMSYSGMIKAILDAVEQRLRI